MRRAQNLSSYILRHLQTTAALHPSSAASTTGAVLTVDHWRWSAVNAVAFYSTRSRSSNLENDSNRSLSTLAAGAASASFAASFIAGSAAAKEIPKPDFVPENVVLYQYEACPFCNKVKAFLDYHDIAYKVVEVNPLSKKEIKWSDYKKVPILIVDGETLVDSSDIINKLHTKMHHDDGGVDIDSVESKSEENDWRRWVDNHLVHVLSPNIYRNKNEALEAFNYITEHGNFSSTERFAVKYAGAAAMYFVSKKLKKKYNITDERKALYDAAEIWVGALNGRDFLGGSKPNLADLAVFGVLRPIRHLSAGRDMVEHTQIGEWYDRMERAVGPSSRIQV